MSIIYTDSMVIDPGHGGYDPGGGTNTHWKEKDMALKISLSQKKHFERNGIKVYMTRTKDEYLNAGPRTNRVKASGAKYCISNHLNAGGGEGAETIHSIYAGKDIAEGILDGLVAEGAKRRRVFSRKGTNGDYYYMHRMTGAVNTVIVEYGFADNASDTKKVLNDWEKYVEAVVKYYVVNVFKKKYIPETSEPVKASKPTTSGSLISGTSKSNVEQMVQFVQSENPSFKDIREVAHSFLEVGALYGIRGDIAFCQSIIETGWFKFDGGTAVTPDQHNYCGMGVIKKGIKGASFNTIRDGVTAQIQHLFCYSSKNSIPKGHKLLDPRFFDFIRGTATTWESLSNKWAMNPDYGKDILALYSTMLKFKTVGVEKPVSTTPKEEAKLFRPSVDVLTRAAIRFLEDATKDGTLSSDSWLKKAVDGTLTESDLLALKIGIDQRRKDKENETK